MLFENTGEKRKFSITLSNGQERSFDTASDMSVNKIKKPREK
jgi:hypothetical protein